MAIAVQRFRNSTDAAEFRADTHLIGLTLAPAPPVAFAIDGRPARRLALDPGHLQFVPAGVGHLVDWSSASFLLAAMPVSLADDVLEAGALSQPRLQMKDPLIQQMLLALGDIGPDASDRLLADHLEMALALRLKRLLAQPRDREAPVLLPLAPRLALSPYRLNRVVDYVEAHLGAVLSIPELAAVAGISPFHFVRAFKASTGLTPHQFVTRRRLERASRCLAGGDRAIALIAHDVGFRSTSGFTRAFRRAYGESPAGFRVRHLG